MRCLIVDDSAAFRSAAARLLGGGGVEVVGAASDGEQALRLCDELQPDVVLLDVVLGAESGFEVAEQLQRSAHRAVVILTSTYAEQDLAELIAASPAVGFVSKYALSVDAIRELMATALPNR
ncbi:MULTISPECIES: LytTR family DNA-binding domain-containing protein [unclassified Mycolicibacterium]|uniref:LytR/AlgR family response regulator transcription factor n=1 Tax=unclassified Mycolicibacterium TaxID=2636767 RepID=UPI0013075B67|nr:MULTISPECIES: response regulator [unclassified Mycolicibacterium]MUL81686.1 response regulator [Mycolicibacterium sp. CBMA 329]MUL87452.1 response regulator [Mycolicibacterium sp. CBMA 331]MUL99683.1 response regulator [Mycolicibacterium sp. CBMA 334]MUM28268.1 response regulator [Mycolicibacterium sp. CBMA 295]MUM37749.1 response regulator [Mycolicibacterium sp. CBMA 247]